MPDHPEASPGPGTVAGAQAAAYPDAGPSPLPPPRVSDITTPVPVVPLSAPGLPSAPPAPQGAPPIIPDAPGPPTHAHARSPRHRRWWPWATLVLVLVLVLVAGGLVAARRIERPLRQPAARSALPASVTVAGASPSLPWPSTGQAAVAVPSIGFTAQSGPESPVPIASLTKMTTALVVLTDHPIAPGASGPSVTISTQDIAEYDAELHNDESTVRIQLGEVLTERQMLEGMLSQSANDLAYALAVWDAGSVAAFVAKMNATATSLGTTDTHYVDASGFDPASVSSASDVIRVATAAMAIPAFAEVVAMNSVTLPVVGTIPNIEPEIGTTIGGNTVVGIKSGYTSEAKGCLVLAVDRMIDGRSVVVLSAVLGQPVPPPVVPTTTTTQPRLAPTTTTTTQPGSPPTSAPTDTAPPATLPSTPTTTIPANDLPVPDPLRYTRPANEALLTATAASVVPVTVTTAGQVAGTVSAEWGGVTHRVGVVAVGAAWLAGWPGQRVKVTTTLSPVPPGSVSGRRVGTATYLLGTQREVVPLRLVATVPEPGWWWRLVHD